LLSSAYTRLRTLLFLTLPHQQVGWGWARNWERAQLGQLTPADQTDIPDHIMSCSELKGGGKNEEGGMFGVIVSLLQVMKPCCPGDG